MQPPLPKTPPPGPPVCIVRTPTIAKPPRCAFSREEDWFEACVEWRRDMIGFAIYVCAALIVSVVLATMIG